MRRLLIGLFGIMLIIGMVACGNKSDETINAPETTQTSIPSISDSPTQTGAPDKGTLPAETDDKENDESSVDIGEVMKLFIDGVEVPVIWEENTSVMEIMEEAAKGDIVVQMSMYGDFEQVGSLGKRYSSNDKQTTTHNGDIVLYSSSNIVMFYGSNSWAYTRLGKIDLPENEVTELLSKKDVTATLKR